MDIKKIELKKVSVITDVICDCCGVSCKTYEGKIDNDSRIDNGEDFYIFEYMEMKSNWTDSQVDELNAKVCRKCVDDKLSFINFKIKINEV